MSWDVCLWQENNRCSEPSRELQNPRHHRSVILGCSYKHTTKHMFNIPRLGSSAAPSCVWMTSRRSQGRELNTPAELPLSTMAPQASRSRAAPALRISTTQWSVLTFSITTPQYCFDMTIYLRNKQVHHQQPSLYSCQEEHHGTGLGEVTCWRKSNISHYKNNNFHKSKSYLHLHSFCRISTGYWNILSLHRAKLLAISMSWSSVSHWRFPSLI